MAIGGIIGSFMAAYLTEYLDPHFSFGVVALIGLSISFSAMKINPDTE
jgi:uncharacterized membrane protein YfcA